MRALRRSRQQFRIGFLGVLAIATMAIAGASGALGASGETATQSPAHAREHSNLAKHRKAKHRKHKKAKVRRSHRDRNDGSMAHGPVELAPGVTESPNGWIHYEPLPAGPMVRAEETVRFQGTTGPGGAGCSIETPSSMPSEGRELVREEIAYNQETCESVFLERLIGKAPLPGEGIGLKPAGAQTRVVPGDPNTVQFRTGHNMQLWVDPAGLTITGLSLDLSWPLYGAKGRWGAVPYSYAFGLDGWKMGPLQKEWEHAPKAGYYDGEKLWGTAQQGAPVGGNKAIAYRRYENIDFYKLLKSAKLGNFVCDNVPITWTVFTHEVHVTGYYDGRMGTWHRSTKEGPCSELVHRREKVAWGLKRNAFPREFSDEVGNTILHLGHAFSASPDEFDLDESTAPVPYDLLPTEIYESSAKLEGGVNPRGVSTNWWAQCGTTEAYGMWASGQVNIGSGTSSVPVAVTVPNLLPNTTYHCRLVAQNSKGEASFGGDEEFTTLTAVAPSVAPAYTDNITSTGAEILGWIIPNGASTNYYFQWGRTAGYGQEAPAAPGWNAGSGHELYLAGFNLSGLEPGVTYHYRLVAANSYGVNVTSDQTFTTYAPPPTAITEPAVEITQSSARLTGLVNPNGVSTNYYFEWGKTTEYDQQLPGDGDSHTMLPNTPGWEMWPGTPLGNGTSLQSVGIDIRGGFGYLAPGTTYHYRIVAKSVGGTTYGADRTFTTLTNPPVARSGEPTAITETGVTLNGGVEPNKATTYAFQFGKTTAYGSTYPTPPGSIGEPTPWRVPVSANVTGLEPGVTYHYRLTASNYSGTGYGQDMTFTTPTPKTPKIEATPPGEVTGSKITMAAKADVKGLAGTYYFEYGNLENYGSKTEEQAVPAGAGFQPVSAAVEGIPNGWTLHYRVVVKNSDRTVKGADQVATTGWASDSSTGPKSSKGDWLQDVSCPSSGNCIAVGGYVNTTSGNTAAAAERWNGTSWTPIEPPAPAGTYSELKGVSCVSITNCIAVGSALPAANSARPLIMKWDGAAWSELSAGSQVPAGYQNFLNDVSCPAANVCEAVGRSLPSSGPSKTLAMSWNGTSWTVRSTPSLNIPGGDPAQESSSLEGISCPITTYCKAVGWVYSKTNAANEGFSYLPVVERLYNSQWLTDIADLAPISGGKGMMLKGVSCPSINLCASVGYTTEGQNSTPQKPYIQRWKLGELQWHNEWALTGEILWGGIYGFGELKAPMGLEDVSCSSDTSCRAVGSNGRGVRWDGQIWQLQASKMPADVDLSQPAQLNGIACPTKTECHAVGSYRDKSPSTVRLAQSWSGSGVAPAALGDWATPVGEFSATLRGFVDPAGVDTSYYFEYGRTEAYGSKTAEVAAGSGGIGFSGGAWVPAGAAVVDLDPGAEYHYRVVATNGAATRYGPDRTFETYDAIDGMPLTEAFSGGTSPVSDFTTKWAPLQWTGATRKGKNNSDGYGPVDTAANGAYFMPPIADPGTGIAARATIANGPGVGGRVSLWLDMGSPATVKAGYELNLQETSSGVYTVNLKEWFNGVETPLGSETGYSLPAGSRVALVDSGSRVAALADTGEGFMTIVSHYAERFSAGNAGIEIAGSTATRVTNFKLGILAQKAASFDAAAKTIPITDALMRTENPLSLGGAWSALAWDTAPNKTGIVDSTYGWTLGQTGSVVAGAYWQKAMASDTGSGDAVIGTSTRTYVSPTFYSSLWLNAPNPGTAKSGYQLRIAETSANTAELKLVKWVGGVATTLATKTGLTITGGFAGAKFALVDKGGTVSAWTSPAGGSFTQSLSAADSTYSYGYAGIDGGGVIFWRDFKQGPLGLF